MIRKLVVGMGELLWDVLPSGKQIGGAPVNFAYHAKNQGLDALAISAIGDDELGDELLQTLDHKKLPCLLEKVDYPTGTVQVILNEEGIPNYEIKEDVAWDNIPFNDKLKEIALKTTAFCFGTLAQRNSVSRNAINLFLDEMPDSDELLKVYDINLRQNFYNKEIIHNSLEKSNILKINDEEFVVIANLFGFSSIDFKKGCLFLIRQYNLKYVILTCGANGSYIFGKDTYSFLNTPKVSVIDTVGAGDSFTAALCASILKGYTIEQAHKSAVDLSAFVCTKNGAMPIL